MARRKKRRSTPAPSVRRCAVCGKPRGESDACHYICTATLTLYLSAWQRVRTLIGALGKHRAYQLLPLHDRAVRADDLLQFLQGLRDESFTREGRAELEQLISEVLPVAQDPERLLLIWLKSLLRDRFVEALQKLGSVSMPIVGRFEALQRLRDLEDHLRNVVGISRLEPENRDVAKSLYRETRKLILYLLFHRPPDSKDSWVELAPPSRPRQGYAA